MRHITSGLTAAAVLLGSFSAMAATPWKVEKLPDNAPVMMASGCKLSLGPKGPKSYDSIYVDDAVDVKAVANVKINGKIIALNLVSVKTTGKNGAESSGVGTHYTRVFKDKAGTVTTSVELVVTGEFPESDSVGMAGTLSVTFGGTTQKIAVEGGTAC